MSRTSGMRLKPSEDRRQEDRAERWLPLHAHLPEDRLPLGPLGEPTGGAHWGSPHWGAHWGSREDRSDWGASRQRGEDHLKTGLL